MRCPAIRDPNRDGGRVRFTGRAYPARRLVPDANNNVIIVIAVIIVIIMRTYAAGDDATDVI